MILDGVILMFIGTGVVFLFLMVLIVITQYSSKLITRFDNQSQDKK